MANFLQGTQVEAHVSRLNAIKTQLQNYRETDGRAAACIPVIDEAVAVLSQEAFEPNADAPATVEEAVAVTEPDDFGDDDEDDDDEVE